MGMNGRRGPRPSCPSGSASDQARSPETQSPPTRMRRVAKVHQLKSRKRKKRKRRRKRKKNKCLTRQEPYIDDDSIHYRQTIFEQQQQQQQQDSRLTDLALHQKLETKRPSPAIECCCRRQKPKTIE